MKEIVIKSFLDLHVALQNYNYNRDIFRGVKDAGFELVPKIGRPTIDISDAPKSEAKMLRLFKERALPYLDIVPENDWEWLAVAQHHGLPTRLLDWTRNPLVAVYFAVEDTFEGDSAVYVYKNKRFTNTDENEFPFEAKAVGKFIPRHITRRIIAQSGLFTLHPRPEIPLTSRSIEKLIIHGSIRQELKRIVYRYGVHRASLFPDLDGLAIHIYWLTRDH